MNPFDNMTESTSTTTTIDNKTNNDVITKIEYKVMVMGDIGTGKSSLLKKIVHDIFSIHYKSTIGVDFADLNINYNNTSYKLQFWDVAGIFQ